MAKTTLSNKAMIALIAYVDASYRNAKDTDENWAKGFREVEHTLDALHKYFTQQEIDGIIINKSELREILMGSRAAKPGKRLEGSPCRQ